MIKSEETTNPNSCLNQAEDDEPVFVLRAHDPLAPVIVSKWIKKAWEHDLHDDRLDEAREWMKRAVEWQTAHGIRTVRG